MGEASGFEGSEGRGGTKDEAWDHLRDDARDDAEDHASGQADALPAIVKVGTNVSQFRPAFAKAICARLEAGESLMSICRSPGMPTRDTVRNWRLRFPAFARELTAARRKGVGEMRRKDAQAQAAKARGRTPGRRGGRQTSYGRQVAEAICRQIGEGRSVVDICRDPGMPCTVTVYNWIRIHREFADLYAQAREVQAHRLFDEAREIYRRVRPKTAGACRLQFDILRWQAARLAPKTYGERLGEIAPDRELTVVIRRFGGGDLEPLT